MKKIKLNPLVIVKVGIGAVSAVGVGTIVSNAIAHTTPTDLKGITKLTVKVGAGIVSVAIAEIVAKCIDTQIDEVLEFVTPVKTTRVKIDEDLVEYSVTHGPSDYKINAVDAGNLRSFMDTGCLYGSLAVDQGEGEDVIMIDWRLVRKI